MTATTAEIAEEHQRRMLAQHPLMLRGIANRLEGEFGTMFTRDTLQHYVNDSYEEMRARSKVINHIPAFVERFAKERLRGLAKQQGLVLDHPPVVLFVCERNDALSQMAAALCADMGAERVHALSAGTRPADDLLREAVWVLHEVGIDMLEAFPKPLTTEVEAAADVIVTLDAHDDVEILDEKRYRAWRLDQAAPDQDDDHHAHRVARDDLTSRIGSLIEELVPSGT